MAAAAVGFAAATALSAYVRIPLPFSPVPLTLQTLFVLLAGVTLGASAGAASQVLYLAAGACGLPVFAGSAGLAGPTAGYLLAFPLAALIAGLLARRRTRTALAVGLLGGTLCIYLLGSLWLALLSGGSLSAALAAGVLPFLPGDALKLAAVWSMAGLCRRAIGLAAGQRDTL